ncbi:MAG: amidohydrolase family protein [Pyrinomonadaceae bacterium]
MSAKCKVQSAKFLKSIFYLCLSVFICGQISLFAQNGGTQQNLIGRAGTFAITGARIVTVSGAVIEGGTVVIQNGKIVAVGVNAAVPADAESINGNGLTVFPGMIDAGTNMGLSEIGQGVPGSVDIAETGNMNANAKASKGINPHSSHINVTRVNGITSVLSMPIGGVISGQAAVINLNGSTEAEMAIIPEFGLVINFPRVSTFGGFTPGAGRQTIDFNEAVKRRDKSLEDLKKMFKDAESYARVQEAYAKDKTLPYSPKDIKTEAMIPYMRGEKPIIFTAEREADIRSVVKFVEEMKVKGIVMGGGDAWKVADGLKKNNIPVIFTNIYNLPAQDDDAYDYFYEGPSKLQKAGVKFAVSTGNDGSEVRDLPYHAGIAGAFGLGHDDALKAVTLYPAQILGIADKYGSVEVGKMANIIVADGDILDPRTNIKYIFINGRLIPLTSRHTELFDAFKDRK